MAEQQQQKILIVDKDERVLRVMDSFLANAGVDTRTASDRPVAGVRPCITGMDRTDSITIIEGRIGKRCNSLNNRSRKNRRSDRPRAFFGASKAVDKWRPCEALAAVNEVLCSFSTE